MQAVGRRGVVGRDAVEQVDGHCRGGAEVGFGTADGCGDPWAVATRCDGVMGDDLRFGSGRGMVGDGVVQHRTQRRRESAIGHLGVEVVGEGERSGVVGGEDAGVDAGLGGPDQRGRPRPVEVGEIGQGCRSAPHRQFLRERPRVGVEQRQMALDDLGGVRRRGGPGFGFDGGRSGFDVQLPGLAE